MLRDLVDDAVQVDYVNCRARVTQPGYSGRSIPQHFPTNSRFKNHVNYFFATQIECQLFNSLNHHVEHGNWETQVPEHFTGACARIKGRS